MRNVTISKTIRIRLTADDWQLYGSEGDVARDMAADEMNEKIETVLNAQTPKGDAWIAKEQAWLVICGILRQYREFGAYDSEGIHVADDLLKVFYQGESNDE
jgi:hypothetical protein